MNFLLVHENRIVPILLIELISVTEIEFKNNSVRV
jgi:hypothetical protein